MDALVMPQWIPSRHRESRANSWLIRFVKHRAMPNEARLALLHPYDLKDYLQDIMDLRNCICFVEL